MLFPYLFNIYSLTGEFKKTLELVSECKKFIDFDNIDVVRMVVKAQVINKEYDEEAFTYLNEYVLLPSILVAFESQII